MFRFVLALCLSLTSVLPASADIVGPVRIIDGDTIDVGGTRIRLFGIDAPEMGQPCTTDGGAQWDCGAWAKDRTEALFGARVARCDDRGTDRFDRVLSKCSVDGADIGQTLVENGIAFAFRRYAMDYDLAEKQAAVAGRGVWGMTLQAPAAYRRDSRPPGTPPPGSCVIKGNISGSGRIYHVPGQRDYERTRITEDRGERWFCSEDEARAAGWRRAFR